MRADAQSLRSMLQGPTQYVVPFYQRPYVWVHREDDPEKDRLGPFWEDVKQTVERLVAYNELVESAAGDASRVAAMTPHFFGAVVIDQPERSADGITLHEVIDGQQRLTTAQLMIAASGDACEEAGRLRHASRLRRLWKQDEDLELEGGDALKLRPTRADRESFAAALRGDGSPTGHVADAHSFFTARLAEWAEDIPEGKEDAYFNALRDAISDYLLVVLIELQPGDNPQGIFESLNAQGERLLAIDLVKNQVFRRALAAGIDQHRMEADDWSPEFGRDWWRREVKQGRYSRPQAELFLMHWLTEQTMHEVSATGLFIEFTRAFSVERVGKDDVKPFVKGFLADAQRYRRLESVPDGTREALFFARRGVLDVGVVFPVVLRLQRARDLGEIDRDGFLRALVALESWLVRRMAMRLTSANYNRVLIEVLRAMSNADDIVEGLIGQLRSYSEDVPSGWWPDDDQWREHLTTVPLYQRLTRPRLRMLLEAAESRLVTTKTEQVRFDEKLTIEHIIPQSWESSWPLPDDSDETHAARRAAINRLGNLTLANNRLNPALGNDPWHAKRTELEAHSRLRLNARLLATYPDGFDERSVTERGRELAALLIAEWPGPKEA